MIDFNFDSPKIVVSLNVSTEKENFTLSRKIDNKEFIAQNKNKISYSSKRLLKEQIRKMVESLTVDTLRALSGNTDWLEDNLDSN